MIPLNCPCRQWARVFDLRTALHSGHHPACNGSGGHHRPDVVTEHMTAQSPKKPHMLDTDLGMQAYPEGFLLGRGVQTMTGWTCVWDEPAPIADVIEPRHIWRFSGGIEILCHGGEWSWWTDTEGWGARFPAEKWAPKGDLLPDLNPKYTGTWAVALVDLGRALGLGMEVGQIPALVQDEGRWFLADQCDPTSWRNNAEIVSLDIPETFDPVEALVHGRIYARQEHGQ